MSQYSSNAGYGSARGYSKSLRRPKLRRSKAAPRFAKAVRQIIYKTAEQKESNNFHTEQSLTNGSNPTYFDFPNPDISARNNGREGNKIHLESLSGTLLFHNNGSTASEDMYVRMIVMEVKQGVYDTNSSITTNLWQPSASGGQDATAYLNVQDLVSPPRS